MDAIKKTALMTLIIIIASTIGVQIVAIDNSEDETLTIPFYSIDGIDVPVWGKR
jgi:hypothetical protein